MRVSGSDVDRRRSGQIKNVAIRSGLILCGFLAATASVAPAQTASRPVARLVSASSAPSRTPSSLAIEGLRTRPRSVVSPKAAPISIVTSGEVFPLDPQSLEQRAFELINAQRTANNLPLLVWDAELNRIARQHSQEMAQLDYFDHAGPDGMSMEARARALGLKGWRALGENIAYNQGFDDPAGFAVERWMISSKHRTNALSTLWTRSAIGVAVAADGRVFLTQLFIAR